MMSLRNGVGKLAEVSFAAPLTIEELSVFVANVRALVEKATEPLVFVCDWREIDRFEAIFSDTIVWTMRRDNPKVTANAVLVARGNQRLFDQVAQVLREAHKAQRRVFRERGALATFLDPYLSGDERRRRDEFLEGNERRVAERRVRQ
jgi:hypothetical protein